MTAEELIDMLEAGGFSVSTIGVGDGTVKEIEIDVRRWGGDDKCRSLAVRTSWQFLLRQWIQIQLGRFHPKVCGEGHPFSPLVCASAEARKGCPA